MQLSIYLYLQYILSLLPIYSICQSIYLSIHLYTYIYLLSSYSSINISCLSIYTTFTLPKQHFKKNTQYTQLCSYYLSNCLFAHWRKERFYLVLRWLMFLVIQDLFFKYTWNNFLHLQVELCVAAILRPCAHEMRLQPDLGTQETPLLPSLQEASNEMGLAKSQATDLGSSQNPDSSAHNAMVAHVRVSLTLSVPGHLVLTFWNKGVM